MNQNHFRARGPALTQMYALLTAQIATAAFIVKRSKNSEQYKKLCKPAPFILNSLLVLIAIVTMYAMRKFLGVGGQLALLAVVTVLIALQLQCLTNKFSEEAIIHAMVTVGQVFLAMTITAFALAAMGIDTSFLALALLSGFLLLVLWGIVLMVWPASRKLWTSYLVVGCVLFSASILFNTNDFLTNTEDPPTVPEAAMNMYIDLIALFQRVLLIQDK